MRSLFLRAPAKINLFLRVLPRRPDGFHNIQTFFERINLLDEMVITKRADSKIRVSCHYPGIPQGKGNLVYKAAQVLRAYCSTRFGATISIKKRIPIGAGLGGGSSDAASTLLGLNQLWQLRLTKKELLNLGLKIGSDVPFFISGDSFSLGFGRGEKLEPLKSGISLWHILVVPKVKLSTKRVYEYFDREFANKPADDKVRLTKLNKDVKITFPLLTNLGLPKGLRVLLRDHFNSLEMPAVCLEPQIAWIKQTLSTLGADLVGMSGSGPSVYAIIPSRKEAERLRIKLAWAKDWRTFVVRTY